MAAQKTMAGCLHWVEDRDGGHHEVIVGGVFIGLGQFLRLVDGLLRRDVLPEHLDVKRHGHDSTVAVDPEAMLRVAQRIVNVDPAKGIISPQDEAWEPSFRKLPAVIARLDQA